MQALAKEMNFSETRLRAAAAGADADVRIRIFTPGHELPFAGHPTLGAAFVLGGPLQKIVIRLETGGRRRAGRARARGRTDRLRLDGSADPDAGSRFRSRDGAARSCSASSGPGCRSRSTTSARPLVRRARLARAGRRARPDFGALGRLDRRRRVLLRPRRRRLEGARVRPGAGVAEDPATGSAAGPARHPPRPARPDRVRRGDRDRPGRRDRQRPSTLYAQRRRARRSTIERVRVGGCAVTVARGEFRIP